MTIEKHSGIYVLRDDLLPGGTKSVILPHILDLSKDYFVYASPAYGGMQIALALYCSSIGKKAVIFCAKRKQPHPNTLKAKTAGAIIYQVPYGYLSNCQAKAREFTCNNNAQLLQFGAASDGSLNILASRMRQVNEVIGQEPEHIFCAAGSGTLMRGIYQGTDVAKIIAVQVGAEVSNPDPSRIAIIKYPKPFAWESRHQAPFPSCANYDLKAWEYCLQHKGPGINFFWNVL